MRASHVAQHKIDQACVVTALQSNDQIVTLDWGDGHQSKFHTVWLRDNCSCDECGDHSGGQRFFELSQLPDTLANQAALVDGMVQINWRADGHTTTYDPAWLRAHCYCDSERAKRRPRPSTWDASITGKVPQVDFPTTLNNDAERLRLFDCVRSYGICIVRNVPAQIDATEELAGMLRFVRETHYGRVFEVKSVSKPTLIANAPVALRPHTDEGFRDPPPGIMIFHSIQASEDGGGVSVMTDGFKLAEEFKKLHPEHYQLLTRVPVAQRRFIEGVGLRAEAPVISLDFWGEIREFRLNERTTGPIDLPGDLIEPVYDALAAMSELAYDSKYHMHHLLKGGEALVFDNARVLHARTGFNGNRHVRLTHVASDEFYSRWCQLRYKLNGDINLM